MASDQPPNLENSSMKNSLPRGLLRRGGGPVGQGTRLPSLRSPRDLTLGGVAKRSFAPKIPVRKERSKDNFDQGHTESHAPINQKDRGHGRGRGRGRGRPEVIQLDGVFAEGPSERMMRKSYRESDGAAGAAEYLAKPKIDFNCELKIDREGDKLMLNEILRDDFIDYDDVEDFKDVPVKLPLRPHKKITKAEISKDSKVAVKKEMNDIDSVPNDIRAKIKQEPVDSEEEGKPKVKIEATSVATPEVKEISCSELLTSLQDLGREELLFLQLPDSLPVLPKSKDDEKPKIKQEPGLGFGHGPDPSLPGPSYTAQSKFGLPEEKKNETSAALSDISEGYLGKLQILKSGKTRLSLGNVILNVEMGTSVGFLQDLMSLHIDGSSGDLTVLGRVQQRLICLPEMEKLFE